MAKYQYSLSTAREDDDRNLHIDKHVIPMDEATNILLDQLYDEVCVTTNNKKTHQYKKWTIFLCRYSNGDIESNITIKG